MPGLTDTNGYLKCRIIAGISTANTSNPPTQAELVSAFGAASSTGAGYLTVLDDNNAHTNVYLILNDGSSYWYAAMTKGA